MWHTIAKTATLIAELLPGAMMIGAGITVIVAAQLGAFWQYA